jgi:hypothetical protein
MSVRSLLKPAAIGTFRLADRLRAQPHRYILILSHMRSGSSLLLHLLMTSPEISGCGERNRAYRNEDDLAVFAIKSNLAQRSNFFATYSVDQVNHTHFLPTESLLLHPSVLPIILFREPRATVCSMVDVFNPIYPFRIDDGIEHYRERVTSLARYAELLGANNRIVSLTYDDLVDDTRTSLFKLKNYLGLGTDLSEHYSTYDFSGIRGDPSQRIRAGRILPRRSVDEIDIDPNKLDELVAIFNECIRVTR